MATFDIAITPSKFIALFLAVNKSSAHPEISSYQKSDSSFISGKAQDNSIKMMRVKSPAKLTYKLGWKILPHVLLSIFLPLRNILQRNRK